MATTTFTIDTLADMVLGMKPDQRLWLRMSASNTGIETASIATASDAMGVFAKLASIDPDWPRHVKAAEYRPANGGGTYIRTIIRLY